MRDYLVDQAPWYVAGPLMALVVVGLLLVVGERIGVVGGFSSVVERATLGRPLGWKAWFAGGVLAGGVAFAGLAGHWRVHEHYFWLQDRFGAAAVAPLLVLGGALIGYGAKTAQGCTSGNGLGGCSVGSPASFVATGTFMATAIGSAFLWRWIF